MTTELDPSVNGATHLDLLAMAGRVRRAVELDDGGAFHSELQALHDALTSHVDAERRHLDGSSSPVAAVAADGQRRLVRLVAALLSSPPDHLDHECNCLVRATEIDLALRRQARLEAVLFQRSSASRGRHRPQVGEHG